MGNFALARKRIQILIALTLIFMAVFVLKVIWVQVITANSIRAWAVNEMEKSFMSRQTGNTLRF